MLSVPWDCWLNVREVSWSLKNSTPAVFNSSSSSSARFLCWAFLRYRYVWKMLSSGWLEWQMFCTAALLFNKIVFFKDTHGWWFSPVYMHVTRGVLMLSASCDFTVYHFWSCSSINDHLLNPDQCNFCITWIMYEDDSCFKRFHLGDNRWDCF